ncbi:MAG: AMP-binding protein [Pseudomonadota bacterium]|nr:AMP-binding protein [Pseudomonadota bacterium]
MLTMRSALERALRLYGANRAIVDSEAAFTWAEHMDRVMCLASVLRENGIGKGDRFGIICRNTWRHCELLHAGYWSGSVPVPVNYRLAPPEIQYILEDADVGMLFVEDVFQHFLETEKLGMWKDRTVCIPGDRIETTLRVSDELILAASPSEGADSGEDEDAILLYTGGTTGRSKGVRLTHRNVFSNGQQCTGPMKIQKSDLYLHVAPMFHSADLLGTGYTQVGGAHAFLPVFTPSNLLSAFQDCKVTSTMLAPTMIILTLQEPNFEDYDLTSLNRVFYGSSPMAVEWIRRTMAAFPNANIQQGYGLTETSPILTTLDEDVHVAAMEKGEYEILKAVGRPLVGIDMLIMDPSGNEVPTGSEGEVVVRGPNVTAGYLNRPEENAQAFRGGWFHTGDVGKMDEDGFMYLLDRKKDIIVTGGENVYSSEVEAALYQHQNVHECAVVGIPDEKYGEALFAAIVLRPGTSMTEEDVIEHCRGKIGGYKIPRKMDFIEELPKSAMGKILKTEIREIYGGVRA